MLENFINQLNGVSNGCFDTVQFQLQLRNLPGSNSAALAASGAFHSALIFVHSGSITRYPGSVWLVTGF